MIRAMLYLILLASLATGLAWLVDLQGGLLVTIGPYQVETTLAVAALATLAMAVMLAVAWGLFRFVIDIPDRFNRYYAGRKRDKGYQAVTRGMMAVGMGDSRQAERAAKDAAKFLGSEPLVLLLQAQSAQLNGDKPQADRAFRAMLDHDEAKVLGLRGLFIEAQRRGDHQEALGFARQAHQAQPASSWAHEALLEWQCQQQDWSAALTLLRGMQKHLDKALYRRQRAVLLTAQAQSLSHQDTDKALDQVHEAVKLAPDLVPATLLLARLLVAREDFRKASRLLEACWAQNPHPELAQAYIHLRHGDSPSDRLTRAEVLTRQNPHHSDSRYALARAAIDSRDFARARQLLAPEIANRPTTRFCLLMAKLEQLEHHDPSAAQVWLARASRSPRDATWMADGMMSDHWLPVSPVSGRLDAFQWLQPQEAISQNNALDIEEDMPAPAASKTASPAPLISDKAGPLTSSPSKDAPRSAAPSVHEGKKSSLKPVSSVVFPLVTSPDDPGPLHDQGDEDPAPSSKPHQPVHLFGG